MRNLALTTAFFTFNLISIMALEIKTSIKINATPAQVWAVLTNYSEYPNWNPFLTEMSGNFKVGNKVKINAGGMEFKPTVLALDENKELRWLGSLGFKGIFDGEHKFLLVDNGDGTTTLEHSEKFKGILVPFFKKKLNTDTKSGFEEMNMKLKERVEGNS